MVLGYDTADRREYHHELGARLVDAFARRITHKTPFADDWLGAHAFADIARHALRPSRRDRGLPDASAIREALSLVPNDFAALLRNVFKKVLTATYEAARPAYRVIGAPRLFTNFRPHTLISVAEFPALFEVGAGGGIERGPLEAAGGEEATLVRYSRIVSLALESLVNDNTGAFGDFVLAGARRVVDVEDGVFFSVLTAGTSNNGPTMRDASQLFSTAHGNLAASGGAISTTTLSTARAAIMAQSSPGGVKSVAVPRYLVVPPNLVTLAEETIAKLTLGTDPAWRMSVVPAANLTGTAWYAFTDPAELPCMITGSLGRPGPIVMSENSWESDGVSFRITTAFAAAACDWRGCYKNPGA